MERAALLVADARARFSAAQQPGAAAALQGRVRLFPCAFLHAARRSAHLWLGTANLGCLPRYLQPSIKGMAAGQEKQRPARAEEVVRLYDVLLGHAKELAEVGKQVGGSAGEALLDECAAKVRSWPTSFTAAVQLCRTT